MKNRNMIIDDVMNMNGYLEGSIFTFALKRANEQRKPDNPGQAEIVDLAYGAHRYEAMQAYLVQASGFLESVDE